MIMVTMDYIKKINRPGLWFVKSSQQVLDISRFVYEIAVELGQPVTILSSQQREIQNEVFSLIRKDCLEKAADELEHDWLEQELSEYNAHGQFWYPEEMNDYVPHGSFWRNYVFFDEFKVLSFTNSFSNLYLIDNLSELWYDEINDDNLSRLPLIEKDAVEYKKSLLVFLASSNISMTNEYIENHLI